MASVTATINVQINAANAAAQLTALQGKVAAMNKGMLAATAGGVMAQEKAIRRMGNVLSGSGMFTTGIRNVHTELGRMHQEFDRGSTTLQKYRQNSRMWGKDHSAINRMAADRVRMLQSQYVALGKEMNGVQQAMQIKPDRMMREFGADAMYAQQRAMLFRRNLQMGSTALVNWGKNTQWAGRQMMVGMGIPIAIMAAGAIKSFNDIEKASIAFKRVYGDTTTSVAEKSQMLAKMQGTVGKEMMKYGIAMSDTLDVSAKAAATGAQGADLIAATRETMRLATLGNMDYNKALEATIAMQTAFNINSKDMAKTTDFLNAVENQTILSMEDMALAVPRVAPVIKGLGGNVEDLAIMMTALRQGGVSAEQGANALKSGLGSLLNPTGTAIEQFDGLGINLKKIVDTNKGDLIGTIQGLGKALDGLTKYDRQRALESLFGKYQYARMGALLKNINSKAVRETMKMAKASPGELAKMSEAELGQIADSPMIKLRKSIEELKAAAAPLGALFSDIGAKLISFATPIVNFFAQNDVAKWGLVAAAGFAALAGVATMVVGVFANFAGSMVKAGMAVKTFFRFITGQRSLAYVTTDELQASAAANSLATAAERAAGGMMAEAKAAQLLTSQLEALIAAQNGAAATSRRGPGGPGGVPVVPSGAPVAPTPGVVSAGLSDIDRAALAELRSLATTKRAQEVLANIPEGAQVYGLNNRTFMGPSSFNNKTKHGIQASEWAAQMRSQGVNYSTSSLMDTVARNLGISDPEAQKAWVNSPEGNRLRTEIFNGVVGDMEGLGTTMVSDTGGRGNKSIQAIANSAIDRVMASFSPEYQDAVAKTGRIGRIMVTDPTGKPGNWYTLGAPESHGKQFDAGTKTVKSGGVPAVVDRMGGLEGFGGEGVPTVVTDKNGKTVAAAVPESSPAGRKISAAGAPVAPTPGVVSAGLSDIDRAAAYRVAVADAQRNHLGGAQLLATMGSNMSPQENVMPDIPGAAPTPEERSRQEAQSQRTERRRREAQARIERNSSADIERRRAAVAKSRAARLGGQKTGIRLMEERAAAGLNEPLPPVLNGDDRGRRGVARPPRQFTGNGMMGIGMLAQTAMMGMEMAGKQVPMAAQFAANGLMGVGMAAQMMPNAFAKLATPLVGVASALGPVGIAVGALALAVGGGVFVYKRMIADARKRGNELGEAFAGTTEFVKAAGQQYQKTSIVEEQIAKQRNTTAEAMAKGQNLLDSEFGKQLVSGFNLVAERFGTTVASQQFTDKIVSAMIEGTMSGSDARGLLAALPDQTAANMIANQIKTIGGGKMGGILDDPTGSALTILQRTANDIKTMNDFVTKREKAFRDQAVSADTLQSKAIQLMNADTSTDPYATKYARAQQQAIEFYQQRKKDAEKMGVSTVTSETLMQENSALVAQVWSESMKTAYRNRIAAEARLQQQRNELKDLDPKTKEAITLKSSIQEGAKNLQKYDAANKKMVNSVLDGYEQMSNNEDARRGMYGAVYDDVGKNVGPLGKLALEAVQGSGVSPRMEFEVALRMSTGELDPSLIFAAATGQKQLNIPMVLDITNKIGADNAGRFFAEVLSLPKGKAAAGLAGIGPAFRKIADDAGLSTGAVKKLASALLGLKGTGGKGTSVNIPKVPKIDPEATSAKRGQQAWGARYAAQARSAATSKTQSTTQKIKTSWSKPTNQGALKPSAPVKIPVKYGEPKGQKALKPDTVKIPVKYGEPKNKVKKPEPINVPVKYDVQGKLPKPKAVNQDVNRSVGKVDLPKPDDTTQSVNRVLGSTNLLPIPDAIQYVRRVPKNAMGGEVVTGYFASGGIHTGSGRVTGPGGPTDDKVNARLSNGEYVIRASSVDKYGTAFLNAVNRGMYDKNGFAKGTPGVPIKSKGLDKDDRKDYKSILSEAKAMIKEFGAFGKILKHGKVLLSKGFKTMDDEFARYIIDNYDPKQIKKMFSGKKDKGAKLVKRQFEAEQKAEAKASLRTGRFDLMAAEMATRNQGYGGRAAALQNLSGDDIKLAMSQPKLFKKTLRQRTKMERESQLSSFAQQVSGTDANIVGQLGGDKTLYKASKQLGVSMADVANALANGYTADQIIAMGKAAEEASVALTSWAERQSEIASNKSQAAQIVREGAEARARLGFTSNPNIGMSQTAADALAAKNDALNAIDQAKIDDINEKYEKQLEIFDQISQQQQAIANLERGRLSVANALSSGDIAAAAMAAQEQRSSTAAFMQEQMRTQLENQQKAQTVALQDQINARMKETRDIQNQIALAMAQAMTPEIIAQIEKYEQEGDAILANTQYINDQIAALEERNAVLANAANTPAASPAPTPANGGNTAPPGLPVPSMQDASWTLAKIALDKLNAADIKFLEKNTFKKKQGGGAWRGVWDGWSQGRRTTLMSAISDGRIGKDEEKKLTFARGGFVPGFGNTDSVSAMLTPGEFIMNKAASAKFGPMLQEMNSGSIKDIGGSGGGVNIDNIIFNINGANLDERAVADIAVRKMKSLDSATIRGGRF